MSLEPDLEIAASPSMQPCDEESRGLRKKVDAAHTAISADHPAFIPSPLSRHFPRHAAVPCAGELQLWRFRREWLPVSVQEGAKWLSRSEHERARLHPNIALRKRFISARVVVRWIVGHLFGCEPRDVDLRDGGGDKLRAHDARGKCAITIDIAYGGIWIVIGIAAMPLGLSVVVPTPGFAFDEPYDATRRQARHDSLRSALRNAPVAIDQRLLSAQTPSIALDLAGHGEWHLLDLPMTGEVRAAVALAQPVTNVWMIGWPKRMEQAASRAAREDALAR
jgi:hypothetical protein